MKKKSKKSEIKINSNWMGHLEKGGKLKKVNNVSTIVLVFLLAILVGNVGFNFFSSKTQIERVEKVYEVKRDTLPLKNGGEVALELIGNEKSVYISYEDLEYISKRRIKKVVKSIDALFTRMAE